MVLSSLAELAASAPPWEPFGWLTVLLFGLAVAWRWQGSSQLERYFSSIGWISLALLWVVMAPYFYFEARSPIQTVLVSLAIPLSLWAGVVRWRGRDQLFVFSKVVTISGLIYLIAYTIEPIRRWLIETVAVHTHWLMGLFGHTPGLAPGPDAGYLSLFAFDAHTTYIVMACTGIGSISIFAGAIFSVEGSLTQRLGATLLIAGLIYALNLVRNVFVGLATPLGWFSFEPFLSIASLFGVEATRASFFVSHTLIAQPASLIALIALLLIAVRLVPGLFTILDQVVFLLTGDEVDLREEVGPRILGEEHTSQPRLAD